MISLAKLLFPPEYRNSASISAEIRTETAAEVRAATQRVEERLDKLVLVTMALWSLMREHTELTEEDLLARIREIDLKDGREDGKVGRQVAECLSCGRVMSTRYIKCLYCGESKLNITGFDGVL